MQAHKTVVAQVHAARFIVSTLLLVCAWIYIRCRTLITCNALPADSRKTQRHPQFSSLLQCLSNVFLRARANSLLLPHHPTHPSTPYCFFVRAAFCSCLCETHSKRRRANFRISTTIGDYQYSCTMWGFEDRRAVRRSTQDSKNGSCDSRGRRAEIWRRRVGTGDQRGQEWARPSAKIQLVSLVPVCFRIFVWNIGKRRRVIVVSI